MLSPDDARLLTCLHGGLPLSDRPFADVAVELGWTEDTVIERLHHLLAQGLLTRFGPLFQIERAGGQFVLAALAVPARRFESVAAQVNALPEVAHSYRRDHRLNLWFVVAAASAEQSAAALKRIESDTGLPVFAFPKEREFVAEAHLALDDAVRPEPHDGA